MKPQGVRESIAAALTKLTPTTPGAEDAAEVEVAELDTAAVDDVEHDSTPVPLDAPDEEASEDGRVRGPDGRWTKKPVEPAEKVVAKPAVKPAPKAAAKVVDPAAVVDPTKPPPVADVYKAPQSWKPTAREKWAALDPDIKAEVSRREKEIATQLEGGSASKKFHQDFQQTIAPYEPLMRAQGVEPLKAIQSFFQTETALRTGTPAGRAQVMAKLIHAYGIDVENLAAALDGQPAPAQKGGQPNPAAYRDPRVDQLLATVEQAKAAKQQRETAQAQSEMEKFLGAEPEFFEHVREDMADIWDAAQRRGKPITLQQAYERACKLDDEVSKVFADREKATALKANQPNVQRSKAAASSVKSKPATAVGAPAKSSSIRDAVKASVESLTGR